MYRTDDSRPQRKESSRAAPVKGEMIIIYEEEPVDSDGNAGQVAKPVFRERRSPERQTPAKFHPTRAVFLAKKFAR